MTNQQNNVGGVDSHSDTIHVAVITGIGQPVADREFPTTVAGYRRAVAWLIERGPLDSVGVEGTSSYGVGITTELLTAGIQVIEVNRTRPADKRKQGKSDPLDAYRAARSVLSGEATTSPKNPSIEPLRALNIARRSAVKAQQAAWRQINALLVNTRPELRDRYRGLPEAKLLTTLHDSRPDQLHNSDDADTMHALRTLARRHRALADEISQLDERILRRARRANPALMAIKGVGPAIGAQLLLTAGENPDRGTAARVGDNRSVGPCGVLLEGCLPCRNPTQESSATTSWPWPARARRRSPRSRRTSGSASLVCGTGCTGPMSKTASGPGPPRPTPRNSATRSAGSGC